MNNLIQTIFDYDALDMDTRDFVQQKTDEIHGQLKRTAEGIIKIGQNLIAVKARLGHGQFLPWLQSEFQMSYPTSINFMRVADRFGKNINFIHLPISVLYELAAPSTPNEVIEMVEAGQIEPNLEEIRKAKEALKRVEQLEQQAQQQFLQERQTRLEAQSQLEQYNQQIISLQEQIATISKPEETVREVQVVPPEMTRQLSTLTEKVASLTRHRNKLADEAKELSKVAQAALEERTEREQDVRTRQQWRASCTDLKQAILKTLAHWPLIAETHIFDAYDWDCLMEVQSTTRRFLEECNNLHGNNGGRVIDAAES